jgi:hypothetical protein
MSIMPGNAIDTAKDAGVWSPGDYGMIVGTLVKEKCRKSWGQVLYTDDIRSNESRPRSVERATSLGIIGDQCRKKKGVVKVTLYYGNDWPPSRSATPHS